MCEKKFLRFLSFTFPYKGWKSFSIFLFFYSGTDKAVKEKQNEKKKQSLQSNTHIQTHVSESFHWGLPTKKTINANEHT